MLNAVLIINTTEINVAVLSVILLNFSIGISIGSTFDIGIGIIISVLFFITVEVSLWFSMARVSTLSSRSSSSNKMMTIGYNWHRLFTGQTFSTRHQCYGSKGYPKY